MILLWPILVAVPVGVCARVGELIDVYNAIPVRVSCVEPVVGNAKVRVVIGIEALVPVLCVEDAPDILGGDVWVVSDVVRPVMVLDAVEYLCGVRSFLWTHGIVEPLARYPLFVAHADPAEHLKH